MCSTPEMARPYDAFRRLTYPSVIALAAAFLVAGCQRAYVSTAQPLSTEPVVVDQAMSLRQWSEVSASYPNGSTVAGPTGYRWEPRRGMDEWRYYYADPLVFLGNTGTLPYWLVRTPPWREVVYDGVVIPPTHHAMPPLPPERGAAVGLGVAVEEAPPTDLPATETPFMPDPATPAEPPPASETPPAGPTEPVAPSPG